MGRSSRDADEQCGGKGPRAESIPQLPCVDDAMELFKPYLPFKNQSQLRRIYLSLAIRFHPDKRPQGERASATRLFQAISKAYRELLNPRKLPPSSIRIVKNRTATLAERGDLHELQRLFEQDPSRANEEDDIGITPLMFAARGGSVPAAELLLWYGADLHARNLASWSALLFGALGDQNPMVHFLLRCGACMREEDLTLTAYRGSAGGLMALLTKFEGRPVAVRGRHGKTLLHLACDGIMNLPRDNPERYVACVYLLLRKGCFIDAVDDEKQRTCLQSFVDNIEWQKQHYEGSPVHMEFLEFLCKRGANPSAEDPEGKSALSIAYEAGLMQVHELLLKYAGRHHDYNKTTSAL